MGQYVSAKVVFGEARGGELTDKMWPWEDEDNDFYDEEEGDGLEGWIARVNDIHPIDYKDYPQLPEGKGSWNISGEEKVEYEARVKAWKKSVGYDDQHKRTQAAVDACPFDETYGGVGDYSYCVVILRGTEIAHADFGPEVIDPLKMQIPSAKLLAAMEWANKHGLDWKPAWLAVPFYG